MNNLFEDPLDSEDFDAVKYINHRFPTGITSSALQPLLIDRLIDRLID